MAAALGTLIEKGSKATNPWSTAGSHSWPAGCRGLIFVAAAGTPAPAISGHTATGGGVNWTPLDDQTNGRRGGAILISDGTPDSSAITVTASVMGGSSYQDSLYIIAPLTGFDTGDPDDPAIGKELASGTNIDSDDLGTIDANDIALFMVFLENAADSHAVATGSTLYDLTENGSGNVRSLLVGYSATDDTPGSTWSSSASAGIIGFIANAAAGGGGDPEGGLIGGKLLRGGLLTRGGVLIGR